MSWHLATGRWILEHQTIPTKDPFSYTAYGNDWVAHEWLSEAIMALTFEWLGYSGLAVLVVLAFSLTMLIIGAYLARRASPVELCLALMLTALVLAPFTVARPMVFVWPLLALWTSELLKARDSQRAPSWWLLPVMTLWINMHASFVFGLFLAAIFALEALLAARGKVREVRQWILFGVAAGVATLLNPHGLFGALFPLYILNSPVVQVIHEFRPTTVPEWPAFEIAVFVALATSWWRGARMGAVRIGLTLILLHLALAHVRHQTIFIIVSALCVGPCLFGQHRRIAAPSCDDEAEWKDRSKFILSAAYGAGFAILSLLRLQWPITPRESGLNPLAAFEAIPEELKRKPVLNSYSMGGPLILRGIPVFIDGRSDLYGDEAVLAHSKLASEGNQEQFDRAFARWRFCWTIFPKTNDAMQGLLDRASGWRRFYQDNYAVIHVRPACLQSDAGNSAK